MPLSSSRRGYCPPRIPAEYAPITLNRPISDSDHAARLWLNPRSVRYGGRWVEMNAMWNPQTKKPQVSIR